MFELSTLIDSEINDLVLEVKERTQKVDWSNSKYEKIKVILDGKNKAKGKVGEIIARNVYRYVLNYTHSEIVNKKGDLLVQTELVSKKIEVKMSLVKDVNTHLHWFNQVRLYEDWDEVCLVGIWPNTIQVFNLDRTSFEDLYYRKQALNENNSLNTLSHVGTTDLVGVKLVKTKKIDTYSDWNLVWSNGSI